MSRPEPNDVLLDIAIGIGADGSTPSTSEIESAKSRLLSNGHFSAADIDGYRKHRFNELLRDETGRIRGCSTAGCVRAAVWERVFEKTPNPVRMLTDVIAAAHVMSGTLIHIRGGPVEFGGYRLGESRRGNTPVAVQYGCWDHILDFVSWPNTAGRYLYAVMEARLPAHPPHSVLNCEPETWNALKTAERAQNLGAPEGPRGHCPYCGLPHCAYSTTGLKFGEGDDYWRTYCEYCGNELNLNDSD